MHYKTSICFKTVAIDQCGNEYDLILQSLSILLCNENISSSIFFPVAKHRVLYYCSPQNTDVDKSVSKLQQMRQLPRAETAKRG